MAEDRILIRVEALRFSFGPERGVLESVDFELAAGDAVGLLGRNGSGKTTFLHLLVGLLKPASGVITLLGRRCASEKDFIPMRGRIGLLFQDADDQIFCPTVLEDVAFGPLNLGKSRSEAKHIAEECLEAVGLEGFGPRITHHLSGGEKKLVALAGVLAMRPEVLLLDEPTAGLDETTEERITALLAGLPMAKLMVSHDRPFLGRLANSLWRLEAGRLRRE